MSGRVLVLGDDNRSCLAVVRSLGRAGLEVWLGTEMPDSIVPRSRYVRRTARLPSVATRVEDWISELRVLLEGERFDLVILTSDDALVPIATRRAVFEPLARLGGEPGIRHRPHGASLPHAFAVSGEVGGCDPVHGRTGPARPPRLPGGPGKAFYLGTFSSSSDAKMRPITIADPWSGPAEVFRACYRDIVASVDGLAATLRP